MRKKSMFTRSAAFVMAAVLGVTAPGCGMIGQSGNETGAQADGKDAGSSGSGLTDASSENGVGRYVESTVYESDGFSDMVQTQTLSDGQIMFLNCLSRQKVVSDDGGSTWDAAADDAFFAFIDDHYAAAAAIAKDGTRAVIGMDQTGSPADGKNEYTYRLYIYNTDNTSTQILIDLPDAESHLGTLAFDDQGALYVYAAGCNNIYKVDISAGTSEKLLTLAANTNLMQCRGNMLMCMTGEKIFLYDLEKKSFVEDETLDSFVKKNYKKLEWTGSGYTAYAFLGADNTVYIAGKKGLYRHVIGDSVVEQVIDAKMSSNDIMAVAMNDSNEVLTAYSNGKIVRLGYEAGQDD